MEQQQTLVNSRLILSLWLMCTVAQADTANWSRELRTDPGSGASHCLLVSAPQTLHDGYQTAQVQLEFDNNALIVVSDANFDTTGVALGLAVDGGAFIAADSLQDKGRLAFTQTIATLTEHFIKGDKVRLQLRFWPTWPETGDKFVSFSLLGFTRAYQSHCN